MKMIMIKTEQVIKLLGKNDEYCEQSRNGNQHNCRLLIFTLYQHYMCKLK